MKNLFKKIILWCLHKESAYMLRKHRPVVIAITGSVGKTTTKDALYTILRPHLHIRKNQKSFNSEIGVPLTVLGLPNAWNNPFKWILNVARGGVKALFQKKYPTHLVLEIGVEQPGDIAILTEWLKPHIVVLTALPQIPVHVEFFEDKEAVWEEKRQLVAACQPGGTVVFNYDDEEVMRTIVPEDCSVITYGTKEGADHQILETAPYFKESVLVGEEMKLKYRDETNEYIFEGILGSQSILPFAAGSAVQQALKVESKVIDIERFVPTPGRMRVLSGREGVTLIDDSYNSSPIALQKGLEEVSKLNLLAPAGEGGKGRKIAILGDMLELGQQSVGIHRSIGGEVVGYGFDHLITIGVRGAHFAEGAHTAGMSLGSIASFPSSTHEDLLEYLDHLLEEGDLVYIKGSQGLRMEKVVAHLLDSELDPKEVLPRHDEVWLKKN